MAAGDVRVVARAGRDRLGEGLFWSARDDALFWVDILGRRLHRLSLATGAIATWDMPDHIGWVIGRERGGLVAGIGRSVMALTLDPFLLEPLALLPGEPAANRVNDAKADAAGRLWLGTMPIAADRASGSFWRLDAAGRTTRIDSGYTIANGPAITPDGSRLLHTDTARATIYAYPLDRRGGVGERSVWLRFDPGWGDPDGMTFDADGGLWVACWGAGCVRRFTPDARLDRTIALPASQVTNVCFAGPALDRMFVTSAADGVEDDEEHGGALFEVDPGCCGAPTLLYAG